MPRSAPMPALSLPLDELSGWILGALPAAAPWPPVAVVDLDEDDWDAPPLPAGVRVVVVGTTDDPEPLDHPAARACDVVVAPDDPLLEAVVATVEHTPQAALALVALLRGAADRSLEEGLEAESLAYSELQAGPEFERWLAGRVRRERVPDDAPVLVEREADVLRITLHRPQVRNALDAAMREALLDGLLVAELDPSITRVELRGAGPAFCSGGDLDEFGTFESPAAAHRIRLERSVGRAIAALAPKVVAHLHGACAGSGIELPAFAGRIVAAPDTRISLPELALGLIPGAGGTVSLPARIGRHRTALLTLGGTPIDAGTALRWGLVDEVSG